MRSKRIEKNKRKRKIRKLTKNIEDGKIIQTKKNNLKNDKETNGKIIDKQANRENEGKIKNKKIDKKHYEDGKRIQTKKNN